MVMRSLLTFLAVFMMAGCADKNSFAVRQDFNEPVLDVPIENPAPTLPQIPEQQELPPKTETPRKAEPPQTTDVPRTADTPHPEKAPATEAPTPAPATTASNPQTSGEIAERGFITPTIYYFALINEDEKKCTREFSMEDQEGRELIQVCKSTLDVCSEEGSCSIIQNHKKRSFNVRGYHEGKKRYFETTDDFCRFGYGVKSSCLDPFYTLAADLTIYKTGDVIYIPSIKGLSLPDGSKHSGYFIIRDQGTGIKGKGRFDFFSGYYSWRHSENPFTKIGLGSTKTRAPYFKVRGSRAKAMLESRAFPKLPAHAIDEVP